MEILGYHLGNVSACQLAALAVILAASGFVSGLSGFGFSAVGATTLWVLPPQQSIPLMMALSTVNQIASLQELRASLRPLRDWWPLGPAPYILGGLFGLPLGLWMLRELPAAALCAAVGAVLIAYSGWAVFKPAGLRIRAAAPVAGLGVGALGGMIGGFTAFPGGAVVIWAGLIGLGKVEQRTIVQPYILAMQLVALSLLALSGSRQADDAFGAQFWALFACLVPIVLPFTKLGVIVFRKISDIDFKRVTYGLLGVSGTSLIVKGGSAILALGNWIKASAIVLLFP